MASPYLSPYEDPTVHARISAIIRRHSSNRRDVRTAALADIELGGVREVLDLGCGFGFWVEAMAERVEAGARFTGMDACDGNEVAYLQRVRERGCEARFICTNLVSHLPFDDDSFDLIVAAYSLYFFVHILPELSRVLKPGGQFLAVTHSESCFGGLLDAMGVAQADSPLVRMIRRFSAENGAALLGAHFPRVERVMYTNALSFYEEDRTDFLAYLQFKLPLLEPGARYEKGLPEALIGRASASLRRTGQVVVQKDDALFICGGHDEH